MAKLLRYLFVAGNTRPNCCSQIETEQRRQAGESLLQERRFDLSRLNHSELARLRSFDSKAVLQAIALHAKRDITFQPTKSQDTERWHVNVSGKEYELLLNGPKFYDMRTKIGGGGAIDLVMYLYGLKFFEAVRFLQQRGF